jgi:hypothetical protein
VDRIEQTSEELRTGPRDLPRVEMVAQAGDGRERGLVSSDGAELTFLLSRDEVLVLDALSAAGHCLSLGQLRARTGVAREDLKPVLDGLRAKGLAARLNTVVESYACRFPGVRVNDA